MKLPFSRAPDPAQDLRKACADADAAAAALLDALSRRSQALTAINPGARNLQLNGLKSKPRIEAPLVAMGLDRYVRILGSAYQTKSFSDQIERLLGPNTSKGTQDAA